MVPTLVIIYLVLTQIYLVKTLDFLRFYSMLVVVNQNKILVVLNYLKSCLDEVVTLEPSHEYAIGPLEFATSIRHRHPAETYGLKLRRNGRTVAFLVDTLYFDGLADDYEGADMLVLNVVRHTPHESKNAMHLTLDDARRIIAHVRPRKAVLTHLGMTMLKARPRDLARSLSEELGIEVIAASDGMTLPLDEE